MVCLVPSMTTSGCCAEPSETTTAELPLTACCTSSSFMAAIQSAQVHTSSLYRRLARLSAAGNFRGQQAPRDCAAAPAPAFRPGEPESQPAVGFFRVFDCCAPMPKPNLAAGSPRAADDAEHLLFLPVVRAQNPESKEQADP
eukprot:TRINITY_DN3656_c0_g1_i2.p1 TRINITY_DN3656_c0_g1~~TRINITY_DN3656_c0_g1_i2.p1  ORF type:complete len:142 (+),score=10.23 TRINITY_DN3656_c0_g1_i2:586-1011(+)